MQRSSPERCQGSDNQQVAKFRSTSGKRQGTDANPMQERIDFEAFAKWLVWSQHPKEGSLDSPMMLKQNSDWLKMLKQRQNFGIEVKDWPQWSVPQCSDRVAKHLEFQSFLQDLLSQNQKWPQPFQLPPNPRPMNLALDQVSQAAADSSLGYSHHEFDQDDLGFAQLYGERISKFLATFDAQAAESNTASAPATEGNKI